MEEPVSQYFRVYFSFFFTSISFTAHRYAAPALDKAMVN